MPEDEQPNAEITGEVDRPRLQRILDASVVRICVIEGLSGAGKTTLVRSWARRVRDGQQIAWIPIAEGVASRQAFWQQLATTARRIGSLSESTDRWITERLGAAVDPAEIAIGLLRDAGPVTLVLDAYENAGDAGPQIDRDLMRLVRAVPQLRLVITTRRHTAGADMDLPGTGVVRLITSRELAFAADEVHALLARQAGLHGRALASAIARETDGYALTVRAAVLAVAQMGGEPSVRSIEWDAIAAARIEQHLGDDVDASFLVATSIPPYLDADLARAVTGRDDAADLLDLLGRKGLGRWIPYANHRPVFQYVETVRDAFRARALDDAELFRRACGITAAWLFDDGDVDRALQLAIDGGDFALADRIFLQALITNPDSYITDRFLSTLQKVPGAALDAHPQLAFGLGLALMPAPVLRSEAPRAFARAIASTAHPAYVHPEVDDFILSSLRAVSRRLALDFRTSSSAALDAARRAERLDPALTAQGGDLVATVLRQLSYSVLQGGRVEDAVAVMERSVTLCASPASRNYSLVYVAGATAFEGDLERARALLAAISEDDWPADLRASYMNGMGLLAQGFARLDALDFSGASEVLRESRGYIQTAEFWPFLMGVSMMARHGAGQGRAEAERLGRELAARTPPPGAGDNAAAEFLHGAIAHAWIAEGDPRRAARILASLPEESPFLASARVAQLVADGLTSRAVRQARALLDLDGHTLRTRAATQTIGAVAALREGDEELAEGWLRAAAVSADVYGPRAHVGLLAPRERTRLLELVRAGRRGAAEISRGARGRDARPAGRALPHAARARDARGPRPAQHHAGDRRGPRRLPAHRQGPAAERLPQARRRGAARSSRRASWACCPRRSGSADDPGRGPGGSSGVASCATTIAPDAPCLLA